MNGSLPSPAVVTTQIFKNRMNTLPEFVGSLPNICGSESELETTHRPAALGNGIDFGGTDSAFAIALHCTSR